MFTDKSLIESVESYLKQRMGATRRWSRQTCSDVLVKERASSDCVRNFIGSWSDGRFRHLNDTPLQAGAVGQESFKDTASQVIDDGPSILNPSLQAKVASLPYLFPLLNTTARYGSKALGFITVSMVHVRFFGSSPDPALHVTSEFTSERVHERMAAFWAHLDCNHRWLYPRPTWCCPWIQANRCNLCPALETNFECHTMANSTQKNARDSLTSQ